MVFQDTCNIKMYSWPWLTTCIVCIMICLYWATIQLTWHRCQMRNGSKQLTNFSLRSSVELVASKMATCASSAQPSHHCLSFTVLQVFVCITITTTAVMQVLGMCHLSPVSSGWLAFVSGTGCVDNTNAHVWQWQIKAKIARGCVPVASQSSMSSSAAYSACSLAFMPACMPKADSQVLPSNVRYCEESIPLNMAQAQTAACDLEEHVFCQMQASPEFVLPRPLLGEQRMQALSRGYAI